MKIINSFSSIFILFVVASLKVSFADNLPSPSLYADDEEFCYEEDELCGPSHWGGSCNGGNSIHQSPIIIPVTNVSSDEIEDLDLSQEYFTTPGRFYILNNGHSVQLNLPSDAKAPRLVYDRDLALSSYIFAQAHIHWGPNRSAGSEHIILSNSSVAAVMEIHLVHYSEKYRNLTEAIQSNNDSHALSVIGILATISGTDNQLLKPIIDALQLVSSEEQVGISVPVNSTFKLGDFLPKNVNFYSYDGSLTTPTCKEIVKWTVLEEFIQISENQLNKLRTISNGKGGQLTKNYRPVQPLGTREVKYYKAKLCNSCVFSGISKPLCTKPLLVIIILVVLKYI